MRRLLVAFLILASAGCLNEDVIGSSTATGNYTLRTLNNSSLPYTITSGTTQTEVLDAVMILYQGGTYAETRHVRVTSNGQTAAETREDAGAYAFFGITLTLTSSVGGPERRGRIEGNTMTIFEDGLTSVYRK